MYLENALKSKAGHYTRRDLQRNSDKCVLVAGETQEALVENRADETVEMAVYRTEKTFPWRNLR